MPLTQEEEIELQQLEALDFKPVTTGLTQEEEIELAELESLESLPQEQGLGQRLEERVKTGTISPLQTAISPFRAQVRAGGQLVGGISDIIGAGAKGLFDIAVPEKGKQFLKNVGDITSGLLSASSESLTPEGLALKTGFQALQGGVQEYQVFKAENPSVAADVESALNIATAVPIGRAVKPAVRETFDIAGDIKSATVRRSIKQLDNKISKTINDRLPKAIQPKTIGRKTPTQIKTFQAKSRNAVDNIIANKDNLTFINETGQEVVGRLPQNLDEFGQSIIQTKAKIFNDFDSLSKMAGEKGAKVSTRNIAKELNIIANDSRLQRLTPATSKEAKRLADSFAEITDFNPLEAEKELEILNRTLKAFYDSPSPDSASVAYVHSLVANNIRKQLDDVITKTTGEGFQELKRAYGALRSIEEDVGGAIFKEAKKGNPGLVVDFGNVLSSTAALQGILTSNPQLAVAAGAGKIVVDTFKKLREPSRLVNKMFSEVDNFTTKRNDFGFNPRSKLGQAIKNRIRKTETITPEVITPQPQRQLPTGQGFQLQGEPFTPFPSRAGIQPQIGFEGRKLLTGKPQPPRKKFAGKGKIIEIEPTLTGDPFIDSKISIALSTPPALRDAEQKFIIDMTSRRQ